MRDIVVIGAGFAGLWSSISAAGSLDDSVKTMFESLLLTGINGTEYGFGITNLI